MTILFATVNDPDMRLNVAKQLEKALYHAALTVTGVWKGIIRPKIYNELGGEDLYHRI